MAGPFLTPVFWVLNSNLNFAKQTHFDRCRNEHYGCNYKGLQKKDGSPEPPKQTQTNPILPDISKNCKKTPKNWKKWLKVVRKDKKTEKMRKSDQKLQEVQFTPLKARNASAGIIKLVPAFGWLLILCSVSYVLYSNLISFTISQNKVNIAYNRDNDCKIRKPNEYIR